MFTGIIEALGKVIDVKREGSNVHFLVQSTISSELKVDQSVAHEGVCMTVTEITHSLSDHSDKSDADALHWVTAIDETIQKTNLGSFDVGRVINLERCMKLNDRLDGHIVQGHVDTTTILISVLEKEGSWHFRFGLSEMWAAHMVSKGSICVNGVSLTVSDLGADFFEVAIIPYTYDHTTFHQLQKGDKVNLEFDIVGKYILRNESLRHQ